MFSISTAEIRWFLPGQLPVNLLGWLSGQNGLFEDQPGRTDIYLVFPGQENLGVKLREGRMEFKKRIATAVEYKSTSLTGHLETWIKWSLEAGEKFLPDSVFFADPDHWIHIDKKRYLQKYAIDPEGNLTKPPPAGYPEKGIAVELSELKMEGSDWWTFGLECFGRRDAVHKDLLNHLPQLTKGFPGPDPGMTNSFGYPAWISRRPQ